MLLSVSQANTYRISLSWVRIFPTGFSEHISYDGIRYYNDLIDELLKNGITPIVTLYDMDLPYKIQEMGGWTNRLIINLFNDFASIAFSAFGDRVNFITSYLRFLSSPCRKSISKGTLKWHWNGTAQCRFSVPFEILFRQGKNKLFLHVCLSSQNRFYFLIYKMTFSINKTTVRKKRLKCVI